MVHGKVTAHILLIKCNITLVKDKLNDFHFHPLLCYATDHRSILHSFEVSLLFSHNDCFVLYCFFFPGKALEFSSEKNK